MLSVFGVPVSAPGLQSVEGHLDDLTVEVASTPSVHTAALTSPHLVLVSHADARTNAPSARTGRSAPTSVTVRTGPSATTSTGPACATRALRAPAARTASVPQAYTDSSVTNTAPAKLRTHSGAALSTLYTTAEGCV